MAPRSKKSFVGPEISVFGRFLPHIPPYGLSAISGVILGHYYAILALHILDYREISCKNGYFTAKFSIIQLQ